MFEQVTDQHIFRHDLAELDRFINAVEVGMLEISGRGDLRILNTGGSSAGEGGMGSGSDDDREKGDLSKSGDKGGNAIPNEDTDEGWDPIKKSIKEAEKGNKKD